MPVDSTKALSQVVPRQWSSKQLRRLGVQPGCGSWRERVRSDADVEIVSLVSDSLETIKKTHSRHFAGRELVAP